MKKKTVKNFHRNFVGWNLISGFLLITFSILDTFDLIPAILSGWSTPFFVSYVIAGIIINTVVFYRFKCPECHAHLPFKQGDDGVSIKFTCESCEIIWDTRCVPGTPFRSAE